MTDERLNNLISYVSHLASANAEAMKFTPSFQYIPLMVDPTEALEVLSELRARRERAANEQIASMEASARLKS